MNSFNCVAAGLSFCRHFDARCLVPGPRFHLGVDFGFTKDKTVFIKVDPDLFKNMDYKIEFPWQDFPKNKYKKKLKVHHFKPWDWEQAKKQNSAQEVLFLEYVHGSRVPLDVFMEWREAMRPSLSHGHRSPSYARNLYKNLNEKFDFFNNFGSHD